MTCQQLVGFLGEYVAGALDPSERAAFEHHLADCPHCIAYVRSYRETVRLAKDAAAPTDVAMPPEVVDAILAATHARRTR